MHQFGKWTLALLTCLLFATGCTESSQNPAVDESSSLKLNSLGSASADAPFSCACDRSLDLNGDNQLDGSDISRLRVLIYEGTDIFADVNCDNAVNYRDLEFMLANIDDDSCRFNPDLNRNGILSMSDLEIMKEEFFLSGDLVADLNCDSRVNAGDLAKLRQSLCLQNSSPDINRDGMVNERDLDIMKEHFYTNNVYTDLNCDGATNFLDLAIMKRDYNQPSGLVACQSPDVDDDCYTGMSDFQAIRENFFTVGESRFDFNCDEAVNFIDLAWLKRYYQD